MDVYKSECIVFLLMKESSNKSSSHNLVIGSNKLLSHSFSFFFLADSTTAPLFDLKFFTFIHQCACGEIHTQTEK